MADIITDVIDMEQTHFRTCNLCEAMCGIEIKHDGQKVLSIKGDKDDPFSQGYICPKATALQDLYDDPDRLRYPVERTSDGWKQISWGAALDKVAVGIQAVQQQYGQNAFGVYLGNPNVIIWAVCSQLSICYIVSSRVVAFLPPQSINYRIISSVCTYSGTCYVFLYLTLIIRTIC